MSLLKEGRGSTGVYSSVSEADVFLLLMGGLAAAFWGATCSRCSAIQGVVTAICPVLPPATAIKLFDR